MPLLKRLLKWLCILAIVVAVAGVAFVWFYVGVNPFEGEVDELWELVSNKVHFFVRFPGSSVLDEPLVEGLDGEPWYSQLGDLRRDLEDLTREVAAEVNPQIPFGIVEVDAEEDFVGREIAIAGWMRDVGRGKLDSFIVLTRVAPYAKFVSALQRDLFRRRLGPQAERLELVKGYYFRYTLDSGQAGALSGILSRPLPEGAIYFGRIKDVFLISDNPDWIESAIKGGAQTLPADPWFESEFIRKAGRRKSDVEVFVRPGLSQAFLRAYGNEQTGGPLLPVRKFVPYTMAGDVTVGARLDESGIKVEVSNSPPLDGFKNVTERHLVNIYQAEKADLGLELSEQGIARFIPRRRTVGALVVRIPHDDMIDLFLSFLPRAELDLYNERVREVPSPQGRRYSGVSALLKELAKDFEDTHLVIISRPSVFEGREYVTFADIDWDNPLPKPQLAFTLVSRIKDSVTPDSVRTKVAQHLRHLQLEPVGAHERGFHVAKPVEAEDTEELALIRPAFGGLGRYFVFASSPEGAEAVFDAQGDEGERLLAEPGVREAIARLPTRGTLALLLRGEGLRLSLWDRVRQQAGLELNPTAKMMEWRKEYKAQGRTGQEVDDEILARKERYLSIEYPLFRERYRRKIAVFAPIDTVATVANLGVGNVRQVRAHAYLNFDVTPPPPPEEPAEE